MGLPVEINPLFVSSTGGYTVGRSLRFRSSASAYLNRTFGTSTSDQKLTLSFWGKKNVNTGQGIFDTNRSFATAFWFDSNNLLNIYVGSPSTSQGSYLWQSTPVYRDPSAWYHVVINIDTTQATATNRVAAYINGVQITAWGTQQTITQNINVGVSGNPNTLGFSKGTLSAQSLYWDGYMAEVNFIDGQALTPSSFGAYDTNGVWQPIKYTGTYGTNGFYLPFSNTTSTTTLVQDSSGNGNNWTPNNISLTAGTTYDSMIDSPTNAAGASTGIGNYAVINPINTAGGSTVSEANLKEVISGYLVSSRGSSIVMTSGKWYAEVLVNGNNGSGSLVATVGISSPTNTTYSLYQTSPSVGYNSYDGQKYVNQTGSAYGSVWNTGGTNYTIGIAVDFDAGTVNFYLNNTAQGAITLPSSPNGWLFSAMYTSGSGSASYWWNFGQRPFTYTPPTGYSALNTYNLPTPTIKNGALYMAATLYTGTGSNITIANSQSNGGNNGLGKTFYPDFVWTKGRSGATNNILIDSVRGGANYLISDSTSAEVNNAAAAIQSFSSTGYVMGTGGAVNTNGATYVGWQWNAGSGSSSSNTSGSITSTVSANTTAGFSVVTWTGPTSGTSTVGHGLGVAPDLIITKSRNNVTNWTTYHSALGNTKYLMLNVTNAAATASTAWNNTSPTSSVFSCGTDFASSPAYTLVAYCFAAVRGYSAFGSYTGNGSTDGAFTYLGFRPRYVMIKRTDSANWWLIWDSSRNTYNVLSNYLLAQDSAGENNSGASPFDYIDALSNGFKIRSNGISVNASGGTYIYAAFAENPFNYSRAR